MTTSVTGLALANSRNVMAHNIHTQKAATLSARVATGNRLISPSVDASSFAMTKSLTAKIGVLNQALRNVNQGIAALNIGSGGVQQALDVLTTMKELTTKANNGLNSSNLGAIHEEFTKLRDQLSNIANTTRIGDTSLLAGGGLAAEFATASATAATTLGLDIASLKMDPLLPVKAGETVTLAYDNTTKEFTLTAGDLETKAKAPTDNTVAFLQFPGTSLQIRTTTDFVTTATNATLTIDITGAGGGSITLQTAENANDTSTVAFANCTPTALGISASNTLTVADAKTASAALDAALIVLQNNIAEIGAQQRAFESLAANAATAIEGSSNMQSTLTDANVPEDVAQLAKTKAFAGLSANVISELNSLLGKIVDALRP